MSNIELVQGLYGAFGRGDLDALVAGLTPDIDWQDYGRASDFPGFQRRQGHDDVRAFFGLLAEEIDFQEFAPGEFQAAGDKVFVLGHTTLTMKRTGRPVQTDWVHVFTVRDGKVSRFREFADTAQIAEAYRGG